MDLNVKVNGDLVTVIMPAYNSADFISESIESVKRQTYESWELLVIDDGSTDNTSEIVRKFSAGDSRIILLHNDSNNHGAAAARNYGMKYSKGRYIAYLDSDDLWMENKLSTQIDYMANKNCGFSCTSYMVIDETGNFKGKIVHMLPEVDVRSFFKHNLLQTVGIMIDTSIVDKNTLLMPLYPKTEDAALWVKIMKQNESCFGLHTVLAKYRRRKGSLSSNKFKSFKWMWNLYRVEGGCSIPSSIYYFIRYAVYAVWKRIPTDKSESVN